MAGCILYYVHLIGLYYTEILKPTPHTEELIYLTVKTRKIRPLFYTLYPYLSKHEKI